jgi:hypothetical protein
LFADDTVLDNVPNRCPFQLRAAYPVLGGGIVNTVNRIVSVVLLAWGRVRIAAG